MLTRMLSDRVGTKNVPTLPGYFGTSAEFWLGLQADFDLKTTLAGNGDKIEQDIVPMTRAA